MKIEKLKYNLAIYESKSLESQQTFSWGGKKELRKAEMLLKRATE